MYETITKDRFFALINAFKFRESQAMDLQERASEFKFRWYNLNLINKCFKFHNRHKPDRTGTGNQAAAPKSEQYDQLQHRILTDKAQDNEPSGDHLAKFLYFQPDFKYASRDIRNFVFGEGMFN